LAAESWSTQELLEAGWSDTDLAFERLAEETAEAVAGQDAFRAKHTAGECLQMARASFAAIDPRLGTSLANFGLCLNLAGLGEGTALLFRDALDVWRGSGPWIARMQAPRTARSSLFHLRMELRHRETYRARWQERWREMADEAKLRLGALSPSACAVDIVSTDALTRWQRERPAMLNDTRKLMAAAFLLLAPSAPNA
jgi:hypothetical protein